MTPDELEALKFLRAGPAEYDEAADGLRRGVDFLPVWRGTMENLRRNNHVVLNGGLYAVSDESARLEANVRRMRELGLL